MFTFTAGFDVFSTGLSNCGQGNLYLLSHALGEGFWSPDFASHLCSLLFLGIWIAGLSSAGCAIVSAGCTIVGTLADTHFTQVCWFHIIAPWDVIIQMAQKFSSK